MHVLTADQDGMGFSARRNTGLGLQWPVLLSMSVKMKKLKIKTDRISSWVNSNE